MVEYKYRKPELEQHRTIWLTKKAYNLLRKEKREQKISMAKVLDNLIIKNYEKSNYKKGR